VPNDPESSLRRRILADAMGRLGKVGPAGNDTPPAEAATVKSLPKSTDFVQISAEDVLTNAPRRRRRSIGGWPWCRRQKSFRTSAKVQGRII